MFDIAQRKIFSIKRRKQFHPILSQWICNDIVLPWINQLFQLISNSILISTSIDDNSDSSGGCKTLTCKSIATTRYNRASNKTCNNSKYHSKRHKRKYNDDKLKCQHQMSKNEYADHQLQQLCYLVMNPCNVIVSHILQLHCNLNVCIQVYGKCQHAYNSKDDNNINSDGNKMLCLCCNLDITDVYYFKSMIDFKSENCCFKRLAHTYKVNLATMCKHNPMMIDHIISFISTTWNRKKFDVSWKPFLPNCVIKSIRFVRRKYASNKR